MTDDELGTLRPRVAPRRHREQTGRRRRRQTMTLRRQGCAHPSRLTPERPNSFARKRSSASAAPDRSPARPSFKTCRGSLGRAPPGVGSVHADATRLACPARESRGFSITRGSAGTRAPPRPESSRARRQPSRQPADHPNPSGPSRQTGPARLPHRPTHGLRTARDAARQPRDLNLLLLGEGRLHSRLTEG